MLNGETIEIKILVDGVEVHDQFYGEGLEKITLEYERLRIK